MLFLRKEIMNVKTFPRNCKLVDRRIKLTDWKLEKGTDLFYACNGTSPRCSVLSMAMTSEAIWYVEESFGLDINVL